MEIKFKLHDFVLSLPKEEQEKYIPKYANPGDAGLDLVAIESYFLKPEECKKFLTSCSFELPSGTVGLVFPRSGLAVKHQITLQNSVAVCDSAYTGNYSVPLINGGKTGFQINCGDRIAQLVIMPFIQAELALVKELSDSQRGAKGFGSSGI